MLFRVESSRWSVTAKVEAKLSRPVDSTHESPLSRPACQRSAIIPAESPAASTAGPTARTASASCRSPRCGRATPRSSPLATSLTTYGQTPIGQYCQFTIGTGSTSNGISGAYVSSLGTTATLPFIVVDLQTFPPGVNGTDPTTQYYNVVVGFNNEIMRTNGAGPAGIS